jgi:phage terminase large subunit GpA-like protein
MGFPRGLGDDYYRQLTSEVRKISRNSAGVMVSKWEVLPGRRNEVLDTAVYADAAALRKGWRSLGPEGWERLAAAQSEPPAEAQPDLFDAAPPIPAAAPPEPPRARAAPPQPAAPDAWVPAREDWLR